MKKTIKKEKEEAALRAAQIVVETPAEARQRIQFEKLQEREELKADKAATTLATSVLQKISAPIASMKATRAKPLSFQAPQAMQEEADRHLKHLLQIKEEAQEIVKNPRTKRKISSVASTKELGTYFPCFPPPAPRPAPRCPLRFPAPALDSTGSISPPTGSKTWSGHLRVYSKDLENMTKAKDVEFRICRVDSPESQHRVWAAFIQQRKCDRGYGCRVQNLPGR